MLMKLEAESSIETLFRRVVIESVALVAEVGRERTAARMPLASKV